MTMQMVQEWTKGHKKEQSFKACANGTLASIQSLGLDWCKVLPYSSGKLAGWISEHYLGAAHLFTWFYGALDEIAEDPAYVPPVMPHQWWTREQNHQWLAAHGLESTGNASDLKVRVKEYMEQPGGPPPMHPPTGGTVKNVHNVVASLKAITGNESLPIWSPDCRLPRLCLCFVA